MDPNEALRRVRRMMQSILEKGAEEGVVNAGDVLELIDHVEGLDNWLTGGGFLPEPWRRAR
jgi:hypothetical protein